MASRITLAALTTVASLTAGAAFAGCVGQPYNNGVSLEQNAYNAGVAALNGHRRNGQTNNYDNRQRVYEPGVDAPGAPEEVNLSGHSFARAVPECERFIGTTSSIRAGLFDATRIKIANDVMALTCDGSDAYVAMPNGQIFVVDRDGVTPHTGSQLVCRR